MTEDAPDHPAAADSEALFRDYARFVASFVARLGAPSEAIDDLVQDVFLTAHQRGGYRPGPASASTFLARLAMEALLSRRRRDARWRKAHVEEAAMAALGRGPADPAHALAEKHAAHLLQQALAAMDPGRRAVFILFELEGESCESIAAGLNLKVGTVYSRLHAARREFRASLAASSSELSTKKEAS